MKKTLLLSCFLTGVSFILNAQNSSYIWSKSMGGTSGDIGNSVATDVAGNVYTAGYFNGTADFNPGTGTFNLTSGGSNDIYVSKLNASGNFVWAKKIGGTLGDIANGIAVDIAGNVYITGLFQGTVDFDPSGATVNLTSAGNTDIFVSKLDALGNFVWAKNMGGSSTDIGNSIAIDAGSNVYITGSFQGTSDFDPNAGTTNLTSAGSSDIFVSMLDASGSFIWAKNMGGTSTDLANSISVDATGNIHTTGSFQGTADFDPNAGTTNLTSAGLADIFISKLDASGNFVWVNQIGTVSSDIGNSIVVDATSNVYITGSTGSDVTVSKLDVSGTFVWTKNIGGASTDVAYGIALDVTGNVYTTGSFQGTVDFDPNAGTVNLTSAGNTDVFVSKLDASGNFVWAKNVGGTGGDAANAIAIDAIGSVYTTGFFVGTADFDPNTLSVNLNSIGAADVFVLKLGVPGEALHFDGTNDVVSLGSFGISGAAARTVEFWIKTNNLGVFQNPFSSGTANQDQTFNIKVTPTGHLGFMGFNNDIYPSSGTIIADGNFHHVAVTYDGTNVRGYVDNVLEWTFASTLSTVGSNNLIGSSNHAGNEQYFNGTIDELRVWNIARTQCEIRTYKNCEIESTAIGLVANYHFNQAVANSPNFTETFLTDASVSLNTGTLSNFSLTGPMSNWIAPGGVISGSVIPLPAIGIVSAKTNVVCFGGSNGTGSVTATGGLTPYTYSWSPSGGTAALATGLSAGNYSITVTDAALCSTTATITITQPAPISLSISVTSSTVCAGNSVTLTASGASTYTWNPGGTTGSVNIVAPIVTTNYTLTGRSAAGCTNTAVKTISVSTCGAGEALSFDGTDDIVSIPPSGSVTDLGTGAFTMESWIYPNSSSGTHSIIRKTGDYNLYINNGFLCAEVWPLGTSNPSWRLFTGTSSALTINTWAHVAFTWNGTSGVLYVNGAAITSTSATASLAGSENLNLGASSIYGNYLNGILDETRIWNTIRTQCEINSYKACEIATTATGLVANYHFNQGFAASPNPTVTALTDASSNSNTGTLTNFSLTGATSNWVAPGGVVSNSIIPLPAVSAISSQTNISCFGLNNGSASVTTSGGTAPYTYSWSPGGITTSTVTGLSAGNYSCVITDINTCTTTKTLTITQPIAALSANASASPILCNGGMSTVTVTATGGTTAYSGAGTFTAFAGVNTYTVTDANSCSTTTSVTISQPTALSANAVTSSIMCNGGMSTVTVSATGGTTAYSGVGTFTALAGTQTYTVTDANSCAITTSVTISEPAVLLANASASPILCNGGVSTITVTATGGTTAYSGVGTFTALVGTQTYTVTDANSCSTTTSVTISEPVVLSANAVASSIMCNGGMSTVTVTATGGTTAYSGVGTFTALAGTQTYTVTDVNSCSTTASVTISEPTALSANAVASSIMCNGGMSTITVSATGGTTAYSGVGTFTALAGTQTYSVTDANACSTTASVVVSEPAAIVSSQTITICSGQSVVVGSNTYTAAGIYSDVFTAANSCDSTVTTNLQINNLPTITVNSGAICAGESFTMTPSGAITFTYSSVTNTVTPTSNASYTITGTDVNSCVNAAVSSVTVNPLPIISVISASICAGSTGTVIASGANTYTWSTGSNATSIMDNPITTTVYTVNGTSLEGCLGSATTATITVGAAPSIVVNSESICIGSSATLTANGVTSYTWSTGENTSSIIVTPTTNTVYTVSGDLTGCGTGASNSATVTVNSLPVISVNSGTICAGQSFTIIANGASTYTYSGSSNIVMPTADASYTVSGTDANGCISADVVSNVTVNVLPTLMATTSNTLICTGETATLSVTGSATTYTWSTAETTTDIAVTPTIQTTYTVEGTDANGCSNTTIITQDVSLCTGIATINASEATISVYPNPNDGIFYIELTTDSKISIINTLGEVIINEAMSTGKYELDIHNQADGVYFVKVLQNNSQHIIKIIKK